MHRYISHFRYLIWHLSRYNAVPLASDLDQHLPTPELKSSKIYWPNRYSWIYATGLLEPIKMELRRLLPLELYDTSNTNSGFLGGDLFKIQVGDRVLQCALDWSDYTTIQNEVL